MYAFYVLPIVLLLSPLAVVSDGDGITVQECLEKTPQVLDMMCMVCKKLCDVFSVVPRDALINCACHPDMTSPDCVKAKQALDLIRDQAKVAEAIKECGQAGR